MMANIETNYLKRASLVFRLVQTARQVLVQSMYRSDNQRTTPVTILLLAVAKLTQPR